MKKALLTLAVGLVAVVTVVTVVDGPREGALTASLLLAVTAIGLGAASILVRRRTAIGSLHRQVGAVTAIAVGQTVLAAVLFAAVMFLSAHDALLICLVSAFAGVVGLFAARVATAPMLADVMAVADGLVAIGAGRRHEQIVTTGDDELALLAAEANRTAERLNTVERTRRDLLGAVSHDLRTPITSLRLLVAALGDDLVAPDERQAFLERVQLHVGELSNLIDSLFELSRLEAREVIWSMQQVHLRGLIGDTVDAMRPEADTKGVVMDCEVPDDLPAARADPEKVQRVLHSLIQNAIRHTPAGGSVCVRAAPRGDMLEVDVQDDGEGIASGDQDRLFEPFVRGAGREARGEPGGSGLGLAVARRIVEAHGGRIWFEAAAPGTSVRFSLPAAGAGAVAATVLS